MQASYYTIRGADGLFREKILDIYKQHPFVGEQKTFFDMVYATGRFKLTNTELDDFFRHWGSQVLKTAQTADQKSVLEVVSSYGSAKDLVAVKSYYSTFSTAEKANIKTWATAENNKSILDWLAKNP